MKPEVAPVSSTGSLLLAALLQIAGVPSSEDPDLRARVDSARVLAEADERTAAARIYEEAAAAHPALAAWLRLSALQQTARAGDLPAARSLADALDGEPVVPADSVRVELTRAAFVAGDAAEGLRLARRTSADADPELWTTWTGPAALETGDTTRALEGYREALSSRRVPAAAAETLLELDDSWETIRDAARSDLRAGRSDRGRDYLERALERAPSSGRRELVLRLAEARLAAGDADGVIELAGSWLSRPELEAGDRATLALAAGRAEIRRGRWAAAEDHLEKAAAADRSRDAAFAAYLLADRAHDREEVEAAVERYRRAAEGYPGTEYAGLSRVRLAFLAFRAGEWEASAEHFRRYRTDVGDGGWTQATMYWEARAHRAAGDSAAAGSLLRRTVERDPLTFYAMRANERRGVDPLAPTLGPGDDGAADRGDAAGPPTEERPGGLESLAPSDRRLVERMSVLRELDWRGRALHEWSTLRPRRERSPEAALALSRRLTESGWTWQGIALGWDLFERNGGRWTGELLRTVFPLPYRQRVESASRAAGLDPAMMAALVRQESAFDAWAVSSAGAVGLAQLMPTTAVEVSRSLGEGAVASDALVRPELNLRLGARHFSDLLRRYDGSTVAALIAYNAGPHRYRRWREMPERGVDAELFIERIPFAETRRYVKAVLRNAYLYPRLYDLPTPRLRLEAP
jgi:soluble lytic murein transglycosylase